MAEERIVQLPEEAAEWIEEALGGRHRISGANAMRGSTSSDVYKIETAGEEGRSEYVLRLFTKADWLAMEPDLARHEAASLEIAQQTGLPVPQLVAFEETGGPCGLPAVLMTKLPGTPVLKPENESDWLERMAAALAEIHRHEAEGFAWEYFSYNNALALDRPVWSRHPDEWVRAFFIVAGIRPEAKEHFIHRDFHPANLLWSGGRISGIVDWVNACIGPAGIDVGHCRLNLAQLHGVSTADRFLAAYLKNAGEQFEYHPYWDLLALTDGLDGPPAVYAGWQAFGMTGLTDELMRHRLDEYLLSLLDRFDEY